MFNATIEKRHYLQRKVTDKKTQETMMMRLCLSNLMATISEAYSESIQTTKMELLVKIVGSFQALTIFTKKLLLRCSTVF